MREVRIGPEIWRRPDMRAALGARDMQAVYRLLQRHGMSQRRIAAMTGQSQSEISEILGGRRVVAYDVLVRIADGFGVPRGYLGLAYNDVEDAREPVDLVPALDEKSGRWLVRVPVYVQSYGAATGLCESLRPPPEPPMSTPKPPPPGMVLDSDAVSRRWIREAQAVLRTRELMVVRGQLAAGVADSASARSAMEKTIASAPASSRSVAFSGLLV